MTFTRIARITIQSNEFHITLRPTTFTMFHKHTHQPALPSAWRLTHRQGQTTLKSLVQNLRFYLPSTFFSLAFLLSLSFFSLLFSPGSQAGLYPKGRRGLGAVVWLGGLQQRENIFFYKESTTAQFSLCFCCVYCKGYTLYFF